MSIGIIGPLAIRPSPHPETLAQPSYPSNCCELGNVSQIIIIFSIIFIFELTF
jgi:hypothetical protein